ncbi:MAG: hypothetical protein ACKO4Q_01080 [Planctomycetota bacterium]
MGQKHGVAAEARGEVAEARREIGTLTEALLQSLDQLGLLVGELIDAGAVEAAESAALLVE